MAEGKLIIPAEVKLCATCTYWDGDRQVDQEVGVVVVDASCTGVCLVNEEPRDSLHDVRHDGACLWEDLSPDEADEAETGRS